MQLWKDIIGYEGRYQVSDEGYIKSLKKRRVLKDTLLKPFINRDNRSVCLICKDNTKKTFRVAKLVAIHFNDNLDRFMNTSLTVRHIDGDLTNCRLDNLIVGGRASAGWSFDRFTKKEMDSIRKSFFRTELMWNERIIDNSTTTISRELGLKRGPVGDYITYMLDEKYKNFKI